MRRQTRPSPVAVAQRAEATARVTRRRHERQRDRGTGSAMLPAGAATVLLGQLARSRLARVGADATLMFLPTDRARIKADQALVAAAT